MSKICKVDFKRLKYKDVTLTSCTIPGEINLIEDEETDYILRSGDIICIIVGGTMFQIRKSKFAFWPKTRLSKLIRAKTKEEMVTLCDKVIFCDKTNVPTKFVFFRSGTNFNSILNKFKHHKTFHKTFCYFLNRYYQFCKNK